MKRAIVVLLALAIIFLAVSGIVSHLNKERQASQLENLTATAPGRANPPRRGNRDLQDPEAREALSFVGVDTKAEAYWLKAINNPALPAKERQDLIEDLNEVGFADPKNPAANELPLILKRLALIEKLELDVMDDVNAAALKEARKDLTQMRDRLRPSGTVQ